MAGEAAEVVDVLTNALGRMMEARAARDALTASASVERGRVTVVVNASGSVVRTVYSEDIADLGYAQIARATVRAAQAAAAEVARKRQELLAPLTELRDRLPKPEDMFGELAALRDQLPRPLPAPLTAPSERSGATGPEYGDAVPREGNSHRILDR
ncbi:YbaB/EbfC family nucleoid-associated protein [Nocardia sp. NPDC005366]|uniref:YbaB/EbfC family nucleoid-associated protein n=1 Tax=Nocardia sp. NPDC005366 TaxID=3156878 RepID=UPI0033A8479A